MSVQAVALDEGVVRPLVLIADTAAPHSSGSPAHTPLGLSEGSASQCDEAVERVKQYMKNKLAEQITIDDLARQALFSKFYFTRVFQRATGLSPGRYLAELRLQEAMRMLRTTDIKVIEVTYAVGYSSVGTFSSRFSAQIGMSPVEYRRRCRQDSTHLTLRRTADSPIAA